MFKRIFWLVTGAAIGFGSSRWVARRAKRAVARLTPANLAGSASEKAQRLAGEVRAAVGEGRSAMREREAQLRAELEPRL